MNNGWAENQFLEGYISVTNGKDEWNLPRAELPEDFLIWQSESRLEVFSRLRSEGAASMRAMPAHLPVLATMTEGPFKVNLANKGFGLLPRQELIEKEIERLQMAAREHAKDLGSRAEAMSSFYANPQSFDRSRLGGSEIFEGRTYANAAKKPLGSLLYTGPGPRYLSFQFNGVLEMINDNDPRYRFLLAARELFANDSFHLKQTKYPFGYLFHISEVLVKTPFSRG